MLTILQSVILGLVQGASEFLPVSSSGHLVLLPWVLGWPEPGLAFSAILHWGTMFAVASVFLRDYTRIFAATTRAILTRSWTDPYARLGAWIALGSLPAGVVGLLFQDFFERLFSAPIAVGFFLLVTGALLYFGERLGRKTRAGASLRWYEAVLIGTAQAAAITPGISRSGATIATGLLLGLRRDEAARFSFLLMSPAIFGAGLLSISDIAQAGDLNATWDLLLGGFITAAISGVLAIRWLLRYLQEKPLSIFALYCAVVGTMALLLGVIRG